MDPQTEDKQGCTPYPGYRRGIRFGGAVDGTVKYDISRKGLRKYAKQ